MTDGVLHEVFMKVPHGADVMHITESVLLAQAKAEFGETSTAVEMADVVTEE